ncbi:hypothetical protein TRFO_08833 [Tritrichomonas foetus]|uniref:Uncharacterized protein n=1 Tax=Tritrichomonas foetus TaxID=1144522 RepID=A0A1J4JHC9_9EUKA|nr:hypothetical protein TRFO_08833 [Tritrichomonas foetus]|eukprot:OHS98554.1 hypothetical protein TRFO_08833 [Tritrichomonas foetus]
MQFGEDDETSLIFYHFQKFQKQHIQMCIYRHPNFQDFILDPSSERHFKHLWNEIVKMMQNARSFQDSLSIIHDFTLFTPIYSPEYLRYLSLPERIRQIAQKCIANEQFSEMIFNIFVQIITPHDPSESLAMIKVALDEYEALNNFSGAAAIRQLFNFFNVLSNLENDEQARKLIFALDTYISFREKSQSISKLSSTQYSRILIMIFKKLTTFPLSLVRVLKSDPFIFSYLTCTEKSNINDNFLPPFSLILKSEVEIPKSFYMKYRSFYLPILNLLLLFSTEVLEMEDEKKKWNDNLIKYSSSVLSIVESGQAGRDAFIFIFLHFLRNDHLRANIENFLKYLFKKESNICRFKCISIFVFSFDFDIFPSTITMMATYNHVILETLKTVSNFFPDSPFKKKINTNIAQFCGYPILTDTIGRASQIAHKIWITSLITHDAGDMLNLLCENLTQTKKLNAFIQLAYAYFARNRFSHSQIPFYCRIAASLFTIGQNLPVWHQIAITKAMVIEKMADSIDFISLLSRLNEGLPPTLFLGGFFLFSRLIHKHRDSFAVFASANPILIPMILRKIALCEIPEAMRVMMRVFEILPQLSIDCIQLMANMLIDTTARGFRCFIRFAAPLFRCEQFVTQIVVRDYYKEIAHSIISFANKNVETTKSFINMWRSLGTIPNSKKIEDTLKTIINFSSSSIKGSRNEEFFYESLFDVIIVHDISFLFTIDNLDPEPCLLKNLILKLPKSMAEEMIKKLPPVFSTIDLSSNPESISPKWKPWPIDESIFDVSGIVCHAD